MSLLAALATPAWAQLGGLPTPALPALPALPPLGALEPLDRTVDRVLAAPSRLAGLVRGSRGALQSDPQGWPVAAGEIVALGLSPAAHARALEAGFTVIDEERFEALDLSATRFAPPRGLSLARAVERLKALDPAAEVTFNHIYAPAASAPPVRAPAPGGGPRERASFPNARLGLIDTGIDAGHPAFAGARITERGFAGPAKAGAHGTAVASLMVGRGGDFAGAAPGAALLVADIYGGQLAGGSATALARALAWMVEARANVVNISLVGPRNPLVERAVASAQARGMVIVAAVGNDGPAAPPLYPASYPGVVGASGVNGRGRVLPEAGRGPQVDFAAPGADMAAAGPGGGYVIVRGSSFAAPVLAGLIARSGGDSRAVEALTRAATDLGAPGRDPVYGHGLVGADLRVTPGAVGARKTLRVGAGR